MNDIRPDLIDPLIHERARLSIMSALATSRSLVFGELKDALGLTDGNLSTHAQKLEAAGLIEIEKAFVGRRPRTTLRITDRGRRQFNDYLALLRTLIEQAEP